METRGIIKGKWLTLRPVLEADLPDLARLLAEAPYSRKPTTWTHQKLKKQFEDEKDPGLWTKNEKFFVAVEPAGTVQGYIRERRNDDGFFDCEIHVADGLASRDEFGTELLEVYLSFCRSWRNPHRISVELLEGSPTAAWLTSAGFEQEIVWQRSYMHRGELTGVAFYAWFSDALRAQPDWSSGEPVYPAPGSSRASGQGENNAHNLDG